MTDQGLPESISMVATRRCVLRTDWVYRSLMIRHIATCAICDADCINYRKAGKATWVATCSEDCRETRNQASAAAAAARKEERRLRHQALMADLQRAAQERRAAKKLAQKPRKTPPKARPKPVPPPEPPLPPPCPRPDKEAWNTREVADQVVQIMRSRNRPRAAWLHAYPCVCGFFHVGDRRKRADDPVVARWGETG